MFPDELLPGPLLQRHASGPIANVSTYVDTCYLLDPDAISTEYLTRIVCAPTRSRRYIDDHDISRRREDSPRLEELLAHRIFINQRPLILPDSSAVHLIDFQTPLKSRQSDGLGKVDLLAVDDGLCVIELKVLRRRDQADTPLSALLEAVGYCAVVKSNFERIASEVRDKGHDIQTRSLATLVLAPDTYWARWDRTRRRQPWKAALLHAADVVSSATGLRVGFGSFREEDVGARLDVTDPLV
jgi:hypothetical protein